MNSKKRKEYEEKKAALKKQVFKKIQTELECRATASVNDEVVDDLLTEDKSMGEFIKELEELGENGKE